LKAEAFPRTPDSILAPAYTSYRCTCMTLVTFLTGGDDDVTNGSVFSHFMPATF
jgi:hypothetical protein